MSNSADSLRLTKVCKESILSTASPLDVQHFEAIQPPQLTQHIIDIFGEHVRWSYPQRETENKLDFGTGLFLKAYATADVNTALRQVIDGEKTLDDLNKKIVSSKDKSKSIFRELFQLDDNRLNLTNKDLSINERKAEILDILKNMLPSIFFD